MGTKTVLAERCAATSREIEETRGRISAASEAVQNRLRPRALFNPIRRRLRRTLGEGGEKILDSFRDNPIPLTLTGIGLGWLILRDIRGGAGVEKVKEAAGEAIGKTRDAAQKIRDAASSVPGKVKQGVRNTSNWLSATLEENPLVLALGILAVGMVTGLSFPANEKEEEIAGKVGEKDAEASSPETSKASTGLSEGSPAGE